MLAWIDLETTGLDPKTGSILEVAVILTDDNLEPQHEPLQAVLQPTRAGWAETGEFVRAMHAKNGLWREIYGADEPRGTPTVLAGLATVSDVEMVFCDALRRMAASLAFKLEKTPLAGSSVHFDRAWIGEHMPRLEALFSHRNVDVSTLNELANRWSTNTWAMRPGVGAEVKHRAVDDLHASMDVLAYYRRRWLGIAP